MNWLDFEMTKYPNKEHYLCSKCVEKEGGAWKINHKIQWYMLPCDRCNRTTGVAERSNWEFKKS